MSRLQVKILRVVTFAAMAGIMTVAGFFCCVRIALTGTQAAHFLLSQFEAATMTKVSFSSAELSWPSLTRMKLILHHVVANAPDGVPKKVEVPAAELIIDLFHAARGLFYIEEVSLKHPSLFMATRARSHFEPQMYKGVNAKSWLSPVVGRMECSSGRVFVVDSLQDKGSALPVISEIQIVGKHITPWGIQGFHARGTFVKDRHSAYIEARGACTRTSLLRNEFAFNADVEGSDIPTDAVQVLASPYHLPFSLAHGYGNVRIEVQGSSKVWTAKTRVVVRSVTVNHESLTDEVPIEKAQLDVDIQRDHENITVRVPELTLPGITASLTFSVHGLSEPDPRLTVDVSRADIELDRMFPLLPLKLLSSRDQEHLSKAGMKGHVVIKELSWAGSVSQLNTRTHMVGRLQLAANMDKVSGFLPGFGLPISNATGEIKLGADDVHFKGISLTLGNSPIVLNGSIYRVQSAPNIDLFLSVKAEAQDFQPLLQNMNGIEHVTKYLDHLSDLSGGISVTLSLKGPLSVPETKGVIVLDNFECKVASMPIPLRKVTGKVRFRSTGVSIPEIKGNIGASSFVLRGNYTDQAVDGSIELILQGSDLKRIEGFPKNWTISGGVPCKVFVKGSPREVSYQAGLDLRTAALYAGQVIEKKAGTPLKVDATGSRDSSGVKVDDFSIASDKMRISGRGALRLDGRTTVAIHLPPGGIPSEALIPFLNPNLELQGGGRIEGDLSLTCQRFLFPPLLEANALLSHVTLRLPGMHKRVEGLTGTLKHRPNSLQFVMERGKVGNSLISGSLFVTEFENPRVEVILESSYFETTDFTAPPDFVHKITWGQYIQSNPVIRFLAKSRGTGFIKINKGKIGDRLFENFRANLEGSGGLIRVNSWRSYFADGILRGSGLFDIRINTTRPLSVEFQGHGLRMEKTMRSDPGWLKVSGNVTIEGNLDWKLGPSLDKRGMYKTGKMAVRMKDGVINRFDILSKLFSLVNLGSLLRGKLPDVIGQGLPFHHLSWAMEVFDNKWKVSDMRLLSDAARVDASGMYFAGQERIDFRMDVSPLVGFDAIFSGLFGNLLTRDGKLLSTTFRIRGLYSSPDVRMEPFENRRPE